MKGIWNIHWINDNEWRNEREELESHDDWWWHFCHVFSNIFPSSRPMISMCTQRPILDHFIIGIKADGQLTISVQVTFLKNQVLWNDGKLLLFFNITGVIVSTYTTHWNIKGKMLPLCILLEKVLQLSWGQNFRCYLIVWRTSKFPLFPFISPSQFSFNPSFFPFHVFQIWKSNSGLFVF